MKSTLGALILKLEEIEKAARKTIQPQAPRGGIGTYKGGMFIPYKTLREWGRALHSGSLQGKQKILFDSAKVFLQMMTDERIYVREDQGYYWSLEPSDFVKLVCGKGAAKAKGNALTRQDRSQIFWNILFKVEGSLELVGFEEYRAQQLLKRAGDLFSSSEYLATSLDKDERKRLFHSDRRNRSTVHLLITRQAERELRFYPISLHPRSWKDLRKLLKGKEILAEPDRESPAPER